MIVGLNVFNKLMLKYLLSL